MEAPRVNTQGVDSLDWREILLANQELKEGQFNTDRKKLLREGVYIDIPRSKAESWLYVLRTRRQTAEAAQKNQGGETSKMQSEEVRVTIIEIPEETRANVSSGKILVEADGLRDWIDSSVFYNSIGRTDPAPIILTDGPIAGFDYSGGTDNSGWG